MTVPTSTRFHQVAYQADSDVAIITMDNPPVNGLSHGVRLGLVEAFAEAQGNADINSIILAGAGRGFSAGGDIREFGTPAASASPALSLDVHPVIENSRKPVIAAIHGMAIGGGFETALVCHYRVASRDSKIGLPELNLGIIPLSGTQRLPRVLGLAEAIDFILAGQMVLAAELAAELSAPPLFDLLVDADEQEIVQAALDFARSDQVRSDVNRQQLPLIRNLDINVSDPMAVIERARRQIAPDNHIAFDALDAIAASVLAGSFDDGMAQARVIFDRLSGSDHVRRQSDHFFSSRKSAGIDSSADSLSNDTRRQD